MKPLIRAIPLLLLAMAMTAPGCGDDGETSGDPARGAVKKGQVCAKDLDCADPAAKCGIGKTCSGALGGDAFETECTTATAGSCAGLVCYPLDMNAQSKTGICSLSCAVNADCGAGAVCLDVNQPTNLCLSVCESDADCSNGFVCTGDTSGKACLVALSM